MGNCCTGIDYEIRVNSNELLVHRERLLYNGRTFFKYNKKLQPYMDNILKDSKSICLRMSNNGSFYTTPKLRTTTQIDMYLSKPVKKEILSQYFTPIRLQIMPQFLTISRNYIQYHSGFNDEAPIISFDPNLNLLITTKKIEALETDAVTYFNITKRRLETPADVENLFQIEHRVPPEAPEGYHLVNKHRIKFNTNTIYLINQKIKGAKESDIGIIRDAQLNGGWLFMRISQEGENNFMVIKEESAKRIIEAKTVSEKIDGPGMVIDLV